MSLRIFLILIFLIFAIVLRILVIQYPLNYGSSIMTNTKGISTAKNKPVLTSFHSENRTPTYYMSNELEYKMNLTDKCTRTLSVGQMNPHPIPSRWSDSKLWRYPGEIVDKGQDLLKEALKPFDRLNYVAGLRGVIILCDNGNFKLVVTNIRLLIQMGWKDAIQIYHYNELSDLHVQILDSISKSTIVRNLHDYRIFDKHIPYEDGKRWDPIVTGAYARNYHLKPVAIMISELQHILFLDGDSFPMFDPSDLFKSKEYVVTGLLQWLDIWKPNPNNPMFEIFKDQIKCFYDWEVEAGQLLIDKGKHENTIQLMTRLMLNRFWVSFVYWGDKDLFRVSALVLNNLYYVSPQMFVLIGFETKTKQQDHQFCGLGMLQVFKDIPRFFHANQAKHRKGLGLEHFSKILYAEGPLTNVTGDLPFTNDGKGCTSFGYVADKNVYYKIMNTPQNVMHYIKIWLDSNKATQ